MSGPFRVVPFTEYRGGETRPRAGLSVEATIRLKPGTTHSEALAFAERLNAGSIEGILKTAEEVAPQ